MLNNLTGLRFYASLWVFIFHAVSLFHKSLFFYPLRKGYLGVDLFFILSGFILTYVYYDRFFRIKPSKAAMLNFIIRRLAKIYPLHILTFILTFIMLVVYFIFYHDFDKMMRFDCIIQNILLVHGWGTTKELSWNYPSWSISSEWFAYLFIFPLSGFLYSFNKNLFFIISTIIIIFYGYFFLQVPNREMDQFTFNSVPRIIPEFLIGILLGLIRLKYSLSRKRATILLMSGVLVFILFLLFKSNFDEVSIIFFAIIIFALSNENYFDIFFSSRPMVYLGNISFAFYLTQSITIFLSIHFFNGLGLERADSFLVMVQVMCMFVVNLIFAGICYRFYEEPIKIDIINRFSIKNRK